MPAGSSASAVQEQPLLPVPATALYQILYHSYATRALATLAQLHVILAHSRTYNAAHQITGVLLSSEGYFVQLLEGPEAEVRDLYATIKQDARHRRVQLLREQATSQRYFPQWHMGFGLVPAAELAQVAEAVQCYPSRRAPRWTDPHLHTLWQAVSPQGHLPR
jgi:hypothetical protein